MKSKDLFWVYVVVILLSLFVIFFVGKEVEPWTGVTKTIITADGLAHFKKGMDVAGGVRLTYKIDLSKYQEAYGAGAQFSQVTKWVKDIILKNIDNRISKLGVSDYNSFVQSLDDGEYIVIEIGGVSDLDQAKEIIGKTVELEFKTEYVGDGSDVRVSRQTLAEEVLKETSATPELFQSLGYAREGENIFYQNHVGSILEKLPQIYKDHPELLEKREEWSIYPSLVEGVYTQIPALSGYTDAPSGLAWWTIVKYNGSTTNILGTWETATETTTYDVEEIFVDYSPSWVQAKDPVTKDLLNGAFFKYANVSQSQTWQPVVVINFDEKGKEIFCNLTTQIVGKPMAIFVGGKMITNPVIREKICGGSAQIDGNFTPASAKLMVDGLNEWALPAKLILAHEEKVSASLGEKALEGAMIAAAVGLLAVFVYMIVMYGPKQGFVALLTLLIFLIVLFAIVKLVGYALSLSGIAAILLSIGMGVDANVLIYERMNEELHDKKSIKNAIIDAYERSWSAIRDGNFTTFMIALLLFFMGTNVFKGFGTMMMVNIILTLIIIVPLTKIILLKFYREEE